MKWRIAMLAMLDAGQATKCCHKLTNASTEISMGVTVQAVTGRPTPYSARTRNSARSQNFTAVLWHQVMTTVLAAFFSFFRGLLAPKAALALENAALRQQLGVFQRQCKRPTMTRTDRAFWVVLRKLWGNWERSGH